MLSVQWEAMEFPLLAKPRSKIKRYRQIFIDIFESSCLGKLLLQLILFKLWYLFTVKYGNIFSYVTIHLILFYFRFEGNNLGYSSTKQTIYGVGIINCLRLFYQTHKFCINTQWKLKTFNKLVIFCCAIIFIMFVMSFIGWFKYVWL